MKKYILLFFLPLFASCITESGEPGNEPTKTQSDYRNFYGIVWVGNNNDNLTYAKQMGYDYIFYNYDMEKHPLSDSLKFYIESPQYVCYPRMIDRTRKYTQKEQDYISRFAALKDASLPFPENLARGWFERADKFSVEPDFQQQQVIDMLVDSILTRVASLERKDKGFEFGGFAWDVPQLTGDFWDTIQVRSNQLSLGQQVTLEYWTGYEGGSKHPNVTHEYKTHSDGRAAFYKTLWRKTREKYPHARFLMEPWRPYETYIREIEKRSDARELVPDLMLQESGDDSFITDERVRSSKLINYSQLGSTSPNIFNEDENRKIAGAAASKSSTFGWFGRFGGTGNMPAFQNIKEVPARLQLVRAIPNWENLHNIPLADRKWDGETYSSPKAYISKDVIYAIQPRTNRLFVVFLNESASATIPDSHLSASIYPTDQLFHENSNPISDIRINGNKITLSASGKIGVGYILK